MDASLLPRAFLPEKIRQLPADLAAIAALTLATNAAVFLPLVSATPLRLVVGLPFLLFAPGYAFIAVLFPENGDVSNADASRSSRRVDPVERLTLSFGLSVVVTPLSALVLNFTTVGIRTAPLLFVLSVFVLGCTAVAIRRRRGLDESERFRVPYRRWVRRLRTTALEPASRIDAGLTLLIFVSVLIAAATVGYGAVYDSESSNFTELYLLAGQSGDTSAGEYPRNFTVGESQSLVVGIKNHEFESVEYTVVVELQRVGTADNTTVDELGRLEVSLEHNESWERRYSLTPTVAGDQMRVVFLLYKGTVPQDTSIESASQATYIPVNVT